MPRLMLCSIVISLFLTPAPATAQKARLIKMRDGIKRGWDAVQHWRGNRWKLDSMDGQNLRGRETRMRLAHEVYKDPRATKAHKRKALRVMRATYAAKLHWARYNHNGTVRRNGNSARDEKYVYDGLRSFGFVFTPETHLKVARQMMLEDKGLRRRTGVPVKLLLGKQPEDNWRTRIAPLGSTRHVRNKLDRVNATLKTAREALHTIRAQKKAQEPN
jgi:hypothetical protein